MWSTGWLELFCGKMQTRREALMVQHRSSDSSVNFRLKKKYWTTLWVLIIWYFAVQPNYYQAGSHFYLFLAAVLSARETTPRVTYHWAWLILKAPLGRRTLKKPLFEMGTLFGWNVYCVLLTCVWPTHIYPALFTLHLQASVKEKL